LNEPLAIFIAFTALFSALRPPSWWKMKGTSVDGWRGVDEEEKEEEGKIDTRSWEDYAKETVEMKMKSIEKGGVFESSEEEKQKEKQKEKMKEGEKQKDVMEETVGSKGKSSFFDAVTSSPAPAAKEEKSGGGTELALPFVALPILLAFFWVLVMKIIATSAFPPEDVKQYFSVYYFLLAAQIGLASMFINLLYKNPFFRR